MKNLTGIISILFLFLLNPLFAQDRQTQGHPKYSFDRSLLSDTLDATNYEIHLNEINTTENTIDAYTIVSLASKVDNLNEIKLELLDLIVDEVSVDGQQVTDFLHNSPWLIIPLTTTLNTGDEVDVMVSYHGEPFHEDWGGFHFGGGYAFNLGVGFDSDPHNLGKAWFPCIDDFQDRAIYEIYVTVDNSKKAVCGGLLLDVMDNGNGTSTWHWKMENDLPTYLASVAIGDYAHVPMTFESISGEDIPIGIYVKTMDSLKVEGTFQTLIPTLEAFETRFGPYMWERVGYVGTGIGAMEHATSIAFPHFCISGSLSYEDLMAHELSHMYFGDGVTCATAEDMWLNEGWAVFCELIYYEAIYGPQDANEVYRQKHKDVLHKAHVIDGEYRALYGIPTEYTYGETVYQKGGIVTHTLRHYIGDDEFYPAVRAYLEDYKFNHASSWDLRDCLTENTSLDLEDFFDTWIFEPGFPEFSMDSFAVVNTGSSYNVTVYAKQKLKGTDVLYNSNRVDVTFMNDEWQMETHIMEFSGETGSQTFDIGFEPTFVMMDYYDKIADATTDVNLTITETGTNNLGEVYVNLNINEMPENDSAFVRVTHRWVGADPLLTQLSGLTLNDYRHWRIDGLYPDGFEVSGSFFYSKSNHLDNTLLIDPNDSIVMLYRPNRTSDWQAINFTQLGNFNVGYITIDNLQKGDYTLAVWDDMYVGINDQNPSKSGTLQVFPNPAQNEVAIRFGSLKPAKVKIFNVSGAMIDEINISGNDSQISWKCNGVPTGIYMLELIDHSGHVITSEKLIIN